MDKLSRIVSLCKSRGFVFPGSEIYGGLANTWDYGPLGVELKNNVKSAWWKHFVHEREDMVGLDCAILMHPLTWVASGHVAAFSDPLVDCRSCKGRFRGDELAEKALGRSMAGKSPEEITRMIRENGVACPSCGNRDFTEARAFNLMFRTHQGAVEDAGTELYLRPETCQGIFVNFLNVLNTARKKIPFGIAQIGKSFRNEITPGNFTFRTREFEQMEIEYFVRPGTEIEWVDRWVAESKAWFLSLGVREEHVRLREHPKDELSHYSTKTVDVEYEFPFGWGELEGVASRTDFDLKAHTKHSNAALEYFDDEARERYVPYVIEPSFGVDRSVLMFLLEAFDEEKLPNGETRTVLHLHRSLAPVKAAVFPLKRNEPKLVEKARAIFRMLSPRFPVMYDDTGSIGRLYRRQDMVGTPFCLTVDFQTVEEDDRVTVRDRDTMEQARVPVPGLPAYLADRLA